MVGGALLGAVAGAGGAVGAAVGSLFAAEGFLGKMFGAAESSTQGFKVERDTVLRSAKIINDEIDKLMEKLTAASRNLRVKTDGEINGVVASAWNDRLVDSKDSYAGRVREYVKSLSDLVEQLRTAAQHYGFTDEEVVAALGPKRNG
jgi:hypothetical protein